MKNHYNIYYTRKTQHPPLTIRQLKFALEEHGFPAIVFNHHIYGVIPYIQSNTNEHGFEITDITYFDQRELLEYLGY